MKISKPIQISAAIFLLAASGYVAWQKRANTKPSQEIIVGQKLGASAAGQDKPVLVNVMVAQKRDYPVRLEANGVVTALNVVEVRPQVSSVIEKVHIKEGQFVHQGDLLFSLDNRAEAANLAKAEAQHHKELASLAENQRQLQRSRELFEKKFQSQSAVDASLTLVQAQQAVVDAAKAAVAAAKLSLSYNRILAPASGRTGSINVFSGSLVQANAGGAPLLTITQMDPIAISFPLPQRHLSDVLASIQGGRTEDNEAIAQLPESAVAMKGKLQFVDSAVDAASGTVKVKAVFSNRALHLWPGAYVHVSLRVQTLKQAIVVPEEAVVVGVNGSSVYVVEEQAKAQLKRVQIKYSDGHEAVITGVAEGSRIIVEGKQNLRPGSTVQIRSAAASAP